MGWTSFTVNNPLTFNRKVALDTELWYGEKRHELIKSTMVGSTYYSAAIYKPTGQILAFVCLTQLANGEFYYKEMCETMGPGEAKCPESILKLLTPIDDVYANEWRERCRKYNTYEKIYKSKKPLEGELKYNLSDSYKKGETAKLYYHQGFKTRKGQSNGYYTDGVYKWSKKLILELDNLRITGE